MYRFWYRNHQTLRLPAKPLTKELKKRKRGTTINRRLGGTPAPRILVSIRLSSLEKYGTAKIEMTQARPPITTITRRGIF